MDFKTFYRSLNPEQRDEFAKLIGTTAGYCHQIACGKRLELGLADAIVAVAPKFGGSLELNELNLTERARLQDKVRKDAANQPWNGIERRAAAN